MTLNVTERADKSCSGFATAEGQGGRQGKHAANHNAERPLPKREVSNCHSGPAAACQGRGGVRTGRGLYR